MWVYRAGTLMLEHPRRPIRVIRSDIEQLI
jgi:hypothetical protein